jgi:hypothetical protein
MTDKLLQRLKTTALLEKENIKRICMYADNLCIYVAHIAKLVKSIPNYNGIHLRHIMRWLLDNFNTGTKSMTTDFRNVKVTISLHSFQNLTRKGIIRGNCWI